MEDDDDKLDQLLRQWRCPVPSNPGLGSQVWLRIADREESAWMGGGLSIWTGLPFAGPALAASLLLVAILAGIGAAELRVQKAEVLASVQSQEQAYFESINPVALVRHADHR